MEISKILNFFNFLKINKKTPSDFRARRFRYPAAVFQVPKQMSHGHVNFGPRGPQKSAMLAPGAPEI